MKWLSLLIALGLISTSAPRTFTQASVATTLQIGGVSQPVEIIRDQWGVKVIVWEIPAGAVRWTSDTPEGQTLVRGVHRTERITAYLLGP